MSVGHIVPGGSADVDGRLRPGDEITYIDSICVIGASHHKVVQLIGQSSNVGQVVLRVRRRSQFDAGMSMVVAVSNMSVHLSCTLLLCIGIIIIYSYYGGIATISEWGVHKYFWVKKSSTLNFHVTPPQKNFLAVLLI